MFRSQDVAAKPEGEPEENGREDGDVLELEQAQERFTDDQIQILQTLSQKPCNTDELVELTQIPVRRVTTALTMLQISGAVEEGAGRRFSTDIRIR